MKRAFQLPLTQAILNAQPTQRQASRLAAPLRRRGAWSQLVDARLTAPADPGQAPVGAPTDSIVAGPTGTVDTASSPESKLIPQTPPALSLKERLELIVRQGNSGGERPIAPTRPGEDTSRADRPDLKPADGRFDPTVGPSGFSAHTRFDGTPPALPRSDTRTTDNTTLPAPLSSLRKGKGARTNPVAGPLQNSNASSPPRGQAAPHGRHPIVLKRTAGATAAAQAREAMMLELIAAHVDPRPPEQKAAGATSSVGALARLIAPVLIAVAFAAGVYLHEHIAVLPGAAAQTVSNWKARFIGSLPRREPPLVLANVIPLRAAPIDVVSSEQPVSSLPTTYGIFASSGGQLIRLEPMNIRLPDSRIALPGLITKPATVVLPQGQLSFIAYQRELMSSAPDNAQLRIVAKVARTLSFSATGKQVITAVDDTWAIRSVSADLTVAPVPESREMVELRPARRDVALSPGRYLLVFKNQTYDFVVAGKVTDKAHCLEKAETQDGEMFTECRRLP